MVDSGRVPDVLEVRGGLSPIGATLSTGSGPPGPSTDSATIPADVGLTKSEAEQHVTSGGVGDAEVEFEQRDIFCWVGFAGPETEHTAFLAGSGSSG